LDATLQWLHDRKARIHRDSLRTWLICLKEYFDYPFREPTALMYWLTDHHGSLYREAMRAGDARGSKPKQQCFKRTDTDLRRLSRHQDILVTSAVNNCEVDEGFFAALERWKEERHGTIAVNPVRYKNPQTRTEAERAKPDEWWGPAVLPYMLQDEIRPHSHLSIMTAKAQATTANPLPARLDGRTKNRSAVFGHPQLSMRTVPTPQEVLPKILYSSGAVTKKSYSDTIAGDMANFHHSLGAVIIEVRGDRFHLREIIWDGQKFIDVDRAYYADRTEDAPPAAALVMGDLHLGSHNADVMAATFAQDGIWDAVQPESLFLHDTFDARSVNHHEANNMLLRAAQARRGHTDLQAELNLVARWLQQLPRGADIYITPSNHDDMLDRWLKKGEQGVEAENLVLYHELAAAMLRYEAKHDKFPPALQIALQEYTLLDRDDITFIHIDEPVMVRDILCGAHGHLGPNGARGAKGNLSRIGVKGMYGHPHSPCIFQGANFVGTSATDLHYAKGPSSWLTTHGLVHDNGYRQMLHMIKDRWRG
jgi:hypothetical protein